jgi:hypothetical protein
LNIPSYQTHSQKLLDTVLLYSLTARKKQNVQGTMTKQKSSAKQEAVIIRARPMRNTTAATQECHSVKTKERCLRLCYFIILIVVDDLKTTSKSKGCFHAEQEEE